MCTDQSDPTRRKLSHLTFVVDLTSLAESHVVSVKNIIRFIAINILRIHFILVKLCERYYNALFLSGGGGYTDRLDS